MMQKKETKKTNKPLCKVYYLNERAFIIHYYHLPFIFQKLLKDKVTWNMNVNEHIGNHRLKRAWIPRLYVHILHLTSQMS